MTRLFVIIVIATLATASAQARDDRELCEGSAIVTGTGDATRADGLTRALHDVLVKRSGDPALRRDPRVDRLAAKAADMVEDILYLDRMSDLPKHDEQGTRDRPYTLIARFSSAKIDAALTALGDTPWLAERPTLLVHIEITDAKGGTFPLTADGDNDERHRQALLAAARRFGMHLVLPLLASANTGSEMADAMVVTGSLRWSNTDPGWTGAWRTEGPGTTSKAWGIKGVSFDEAYRDLVWGAMATASGHTAP